MNTYKIPEPVEVIDKRSGKKGYKIFDFYWYENGKRRKSDTRFCLTKSEARKAALSKIEGSVDAAYSVANKSLKDLLEDYNVF